MKRSCGIENQPESNSGRVRGLPFSFTALLLSAVLLTFASCGAFAQAANETPKKDEPAAAGKIPAGNAQNGKQLFTADGCYECHDRSGEGGAGTGPRLAPHPLPLAVIINYIRQPTDAMPPYTAKVISDAEIADIYAFLQSIPDPPKVDTIPLLKPK